MDRRRPHRSSAHNPGEDHRAGREHRPLNGTRRAGLRSSGLSPTDRHLAEGVPCRLAWIVNVSDGVTIRRQLATANPAAHEPDLAASLTNLTVRLAEAGRRPEALAAIEEAGG